MNISFLPVLQSDIETISILQPEGWSVLADAFHYYLESSFCYPIKAVYDKNIIGIGCAISFIQTGWLAHIIVHQDYRNQGTGTAIAQHLINYLIHMGHKTISLIATDLGYPIYLKIGFREEMEYAFFERNEKTEFIKHENIVRITAKDYQKILTLDKTISGENRQNLLHRHLDNGYFFHSGSSPDGFYFPNLGEGTVVAADMTAAVELLKFRSQYTNKGALPVNNIAGCDFYRNHGYTEKPRIKRMIYGEVFNWQPTCIYNRIGGNFG